MWFGELPIIGIENKTCSKKILKQDARNMLTILRSMVIEVGYMFIS